MPYIPAGWDGWKNREGKNWHPATIQGILRRLLYIGIIKCGDSQSDVLEKLRIIDNETFYAVQRMLESRSKKSQALKPTCISTKGVALLSGFTFCGHCGARLCVTTSGKGRKRADGTDIVRIRYTCQTHRDRKPSRLFDESAPVTVSHKRFPVLPLEKLEPSNGEFDLTNRLLRAYNESRKVDRRK